MKGIDRFTGTRMLSRRAGDGLIVGWRSLERRSGTGARKPRIHVIIFIMRFTRSWVDPLDFPCTCIQETPLFEVEVLLWFSSLRYNKMLACDSKGRFFLTIFITSGSWCQSQDCQLKSYLNSKLLLLHAAGNPHFNHLTAGYALIGQSGCPQEVLVLKRHWTE